MAPLIRIANRRQAQRRAAQASTLHPVAHSPGSVLPRTDLSPWLAPRDNLLSHPGIEGEPGGLRRLRPQQASAAARDNPLLIQSNLGIRNIAKCTGNRLLVIRHHLLFDFLGKLQLSAKLSAFEEGLGQGSDAVDRLSSGIEDDGEAVPARSAGSADRKIGKKLRPRHADLRIRGDEGGLCLFNIGPAFQQLGRQPRGKFLRRRSKRIRVPTPT